ncbi:MAG: hypothetical protein IT181_03920, partial [Acidobacteria bacterium]|nr:hypothetical protein [Acidobacteriota bacterium]
MTRTRFAAAVVTLATTLTATAPLAGAQTTPPPALSDARWAAWLGCWRAADDPSANGTRTCVVPAGGGVAVRTIVGGQLVGEELRVADGAPRPVREAGCTGTETATWAADGQRVYRRAQASCGTERPRTLASASYFVPGPIWVD